MDLRQAMLLGVAFLAAGAFAVAGCQRQEQSAASESSQQSGNTSASTGTTDRSTVETARLRGMSELFDDAAMTTKVKLALASSVGSSSTQINVDTRASVVTLTGEVDTPDIRDRANQAALEIAGVRSVIDNIVVKSSATG